MKNIILFLNLSCTIAAYACDTPDFELTLMTGHEASIDYKMGKDLQRLLRPHCIDLNVIPSMGSVENIVKVYEFPSIQLGIAQLDTLTYPALHALVHPFGVTSELQNIVSNMQLVLPLYSKTVHILAPESLKTLADLNGKTIATGRLSSSVHGTALSLLRMFQIKPAKTLAIDTPHALQLLQAGKLDALIAVAALPDPDLSQLSFKGFHLLPIDLEQAQDKQVLQHLYQAKPITQQDYAWQKQTVVSIAVRSILATADKGQCENIGKVAALIYQNLAWLQKNGNQMWQDVQFEKDNLLKHRSLSPCVKPALLN